MYSSKITCTVSDFRYIVSKPPNSSLLLHASLRDYSLDALDSIRAIIVDDWDEVCRENTDIELLHRERGLTRAQTRSIMDVVCRDALLDFSSEEPVLFCPMGMGVFDVAIAAYYANLAEEHGVGMVLD